MWMGSRRSRCETTASSTSLATNRPRNDYSSDHLHWLAQLKAVWAQGSAAFACAGTVQGTRACRRGKVGAQQPSCIGAAASILHAGI